MRRTLVPTSAARAVVLILGSTVLAPPLSAQGGGRSSGSDGLLDLSLEELMRVRLPSMTSVLAGHVHNRGEWMPMLNAMHMQMRGLRDGNDDLALADVHATFPIAPTEMTMDMVMAGVMYGVTDRFTLMAMLPYHWRAMKHRTAGGAEFRTESDGIGDLELTALGVVHEDYEAQFHAGLGLAVPTGSIDEQDVTPMGLGQLPYPMQPGSGTWDLRPVVTWVTETPQHAWGVQGHGTLRTGRNDNGYRLGHRYEVTGWVQREWTRSFSSSIRVLGLSWGNVSGQDERLNPALPGLNPAADPNRQGGERLDLALGIQLYSPEGALSGHRLELELGSPVAESLDGPQLSTEWWASIGWSITL